ncbi:MAG: hypothetical protein H6740_26450 [Alphaproteobacteria bacterium]|nr:hypothetical protein [Alphaproteobacteria bacterium]
MDETQRKTYLKLKTEEERNAYLKELGIWDYFYKYDEDLRDQIVAGDVQVGWTKDQLYMAWGAPHDRAKLVGRDAVRSERLIYRFEGHADGSILVWEPNSKTEYKATRLFRREVILDDDVVTGSRRTAGNEPGPLRQEWTPDGPGGYLCTSCLPAPPLRVEDGSRPGQRTPDLSPTSGLRTLLSSASPSRHETLHLRLPDFAGDGSLPTSG